MRYLTLIMLGKAGNKPSWFKIRARNAKGRDRSLAPAGQRSDQGSRATLKKHQTCQAAGRGVKAFPTPKKKKEEGRWG